MAMTILKQAKWMKPGNYNCGLGRSLYIHTLPWFC